jgi:predicted nucleic acid-binding Zn ribbon protein
MEPGRSLVVAGTLLLTVSALVGFVQERYREEPAASARWRVVHAGGTAGAVQLLALAAVWQRFLARGPWTALVAVGLIFSTWAFFVGPLARATGHGRVARSINGVGALVAFPAYLALPLLLFL